ncbi:MAG TPA: nuclear transport factor 2 family protein [Steroidobacteraceae bacterium]
MKHASESRLCPLCRTTISSSSAKVSGGHRPTYHAPILDDLAAARWVQAYDAAWLGQDWDTFASYLAPGVEFVVPGLFDAMIGRAAILESLRHALAGMEIHEYNRTELTGHDRGSCGIITYRWQLDSSVGKQRMHTSGRDVLVLSVTDGRWVLVWRGQFSL